MTAAPSIIDTARPPREREALLLAGLLRSSRLTLLCGAPGGGKSTLLRTGLMPLLRRRADDRALRAVPPPPLVRPDPERVVIPFPDRRQRAAAGALQGGGELALLFDDWRSDPLPRLRQQLLEALGTQSPAEAKRSPASLSALIASAGQARGLRLLILLDAFEQHLEAPLLRTDVQRFDDQLVQIVNDPSLPVHFLISMRFEARPLLERFRGRLHGLDNNWLNLPAPPETGGVAPLDTGARRATLVAVPVSMPATGAAAAAAPPPVLAPVVPPVLSLASAPARVAVAAPPPPEAAPLQPRPRPESESESESEPAQAQALVQVLAQAQASAATPLAPHPLAPQPHAQPPARPPVAVRAPASTAEPDRFRWRVALLSTLSALGLAAALAYWGASREGRGPGSAAAPVQPAAAAASAVALVARQPQPQPAAPPPAAPAPLAWPVQTGAEQRTDARMAAELMRRLPATLQGPPLQIVHYDALQAARHDPNAALRIVAPLVPEELHLVVRADSPLSYIHQIRGRTIDVGPTVPGRPATAAVLYERLFGQPLPAAQTRSSAWPEALAALAAGRTEVAVLVDAEPSTWLAEMPAAARAGIKLLALDPAAPESRRALQGFLPATVRALGGAPASTQASTQAGTQESAQAAAQASAQARAAGTPSLAVMSFLVVDETAPAITAAARPAAAEPPRGQPADDPLVQLAQTLCRELPALRREGHPKWQEAQPALYLPVGWPYATAAHQALKDCASAPAASPARQPVTGDPR